MSEPPLRRNDENPVNDPGLSLSAPDGNAETLPLNTATTPDEPVKKVPTRSPSAEAPSLAATQIDRSLEDVGLAPTMVTPTGVDQTLDFVRNEVRRKATAVLHTKVGDYEIERELGRGAMGIVYKARHHQLRRDVALKMILAGKHAGPEQLERFLTEAQSVAQLQHPNIVQIFDIGEQDGLPYFSLEFVDGRSLAQVIDKQPQDPREAAQTIEVLARTMQYAHDHGVLHRDLKPANVLLSKEGVSKISDFGLAKKVTDDESENTRTGTVMGTPSYMSPEQASGLTHDVGPAADQYSLGAMLYEMLTGRPPFLAAKPIDTILQVIHDEPVPPKQLQPGTPVDLETICLKALQKDIDKRYANCTELANDLNRFLNGEPIIARPVGSLERAWRWCKRNPKIAGLVATVLALLVVGFIGSTLAAITIAHERDQKETQRRGAEEAKIAAQNAEKKAEHSREIAEQQAVNAVRVFYDVITKADVKLRSQPGEGMQNLRLEVLEDTRQGLDRVLEKAQDSPRFNRTTAALHQHMGDVYKELGRTEEAQQFYLKSLAIIEKMTAQNPDDDANVFNHAAILEKLGNVALELENIGVARKYHAMSLEHRIRLTQIKRVDPILTPEKVKLTLGNAYRTQSELALMLGDPQVSWDYMSRYLELNGGRRFATPREFLEALLAGTVDKAFERVSFQIRAGEISFRLNDVETCRALYTRAHERGETALTKAPTRPDAKQAVAYSSGALGDLEIALGNPTAAVPYYSKAHEIISSLVAADPENATNQRVLSQSHYRLGAAKLLSGVADAAREQFEQCLNLRRRLADADPRNVHKQIDLMIALARCAQHVAAANVAAELGSRTAEDPSVLYQIACGYSLCSAAVVHGKADADRKTDERNQMDLYARQAIQAVREAIAKGYKDRMALETDPDLLPIRDRTEFREVIETLKRDSS